MEVEPAQPSRKARVRGPTLVSSLALAVVITLIGVGLALSGPVDAATWYVTCPDLITEGETAHMKVRRPGYRIVKLHAFTSHGSHTADDGDYVAYHGEAIDNNGDKSLWIPIITIEDTEPGHDETFEVGFWHQDVYRGCTITIDDDLPEITDVAISSRPVRGDTYRAG